MPLKRLLDIAGAAGGLLFFLPAMTAVSIAILLEDGFPLLFRQERLGAGRRPFTILKFRSMRDGRVTRVGRVLRSTGLDELPQFVNVLRGEMSAVGPRPLTAADTMRLGWTASRYDDRFTVRPGLTGLAQVVGSHASRSSLFLDRRHIARQGVWLDAQLIALSFAINALGKQRVRDRYWRHGRKDRSSGFGFDGFTIESRIASCLRNPCVKSRIPSPESPHHSAVDSGRQKPAGGTAQGSATNFLKSAAALPAAAVTPPAAAAQPPSPVPEASTITRPGSDFMVDILKSLDFEYAFSNPANTFRSLHESIINYGGNKSPELLTCCHEESSVAMAHGYAKIEGKPMLVMAHGTVGAARHDGGARRVLRSRAGLPDPRQPPRRDGPSQRAVTWSHSAQDAAAILRDFTKGRCTGIAGAFRRAAVRATRSPRRRRWRRWRSSPTPICRASLRRGCIPARADVAAAGRRGRRRRGRPSAVAAAENPVIVVDRMRARRPDSRGSPSSPISSRPRWSTARAG
jgi:lipopolysaccharide/colanic/teichoic acid biosynthesis glycosyltransferase